MIRIIAVRLLGGTDHEHLVAVRWRDPKSGVTAESTLDEVVEWITRRNGDVRLIDATGRELQVGIAGTPRPHLRARHENAWSDALLALPRY